MLRLADMNMNPIHAGLTREMRDDPFYMKYPCASIHRGRLYSNEKRVCTAKRRGDKFNVKRIRNISVTCLLFACLPALVSFHFSFCSVPLASL